ncbi:putative lipopolysaccharide heptosyltransferase II [Candidatus Protochlamydia naegleriophila]|uniref:lipopolysaccharide heptosyltransferase II n=1 Tax=Candidatus Protochlamydia naegleriophila TaxID=389348 RepID=A0A0U5K6Y0_9BACT|nr:lipopolysaccharide heptosyltransferase II [Candidatus Protochlamydia naegleriophila]CUI17931.1 putative lipopolysaccharide heptosyltransferase II [Candidatus Protochlamydia naegleriophila]
MGSKPPLSIHPRNILVRMPNWLGDFVMATPILTDLRHHWPEAKITAMCQGALGSVIQEDPHIDSVLNFKKTKNLLNNRVSDEIVSLQTEHYDLGILLTNSFSSAWWLWKGNVQNRLGFASHWRSWLLNYPVPFPAERSKQHLVTTYKQLLHPLGIPLSSTDPKLYIAKQEQNAIQEWLFKEGIHKEDLIIGINPGAAYGSAKCWLPDRFTILAAKLLENPRIKIVFFGDKAGAPLVEDICTKLPKRVVNLAGKTSLRELMAFIQACDIFLTNDSGPMHVASALSTPLIALFGSTSDVATGPYKGGKVIHKHVPCSPCYRRECPIDFRCMKQIEVDEVYRELQELVNEASQTSAVRSS